MPDTNIDIAEGGPVSTIALRRLFDRAAGQSLLDPCSDLAWFYDLKTNPSCMALAYYVGDSIHDMNRKYGQVHEFTHYFEVADWIVRNSKAFSNAPDVQAFLAFAHDIVEVLRDDFHRDISAKDVVDECWSGDERHIPVLISGLTLLTDSQGLKKPERMLEQIGRAQNEMDQLANDVRFADKFCTFTRDLDNMQRGRHVFADRAEADAYLDRRLRPRMLVVENLRVSEDWKVQFRDLSAKIEGFIDKAFPSTPSPGQVDVPRPTYEAA